MLRRALLLAGLGMALAACGGGGGGEDFLLDPTTAPRPTETSPAVFGGGGATTPGAGRTPTPLAAGETPTPYPSGPEGAVNLDIITIGPIGNEELADSGPDESDEPPIGPWVTPLIAWDAVDSTFGEDRGEPLVHGGIDFHVGSTPGVDVYAVCDGYVAGIDYSETHGTYIVLKCPDRWTVVYGFLEIVDVQLNEDVVKGESVLGAVDTFLHFEMRWDFKPLDPMRQLQFHVRPKGVLLEPTPTPTSTPEPTDIPEDTPTPVPTNTPTNGGGGGGGSAPTPVPTNTAVPTPAGPPTATPTPSNTPTPEATPTPTPKPPTPTPTPLPQAF